jgi:fanconi-associated nuclease 1
MPLQPQSPASHNRMLGRRIPHPKSTNFDEEPSDSTRPAKRPRIHGNAPVTKSPGKGTPSDTPDSEDELDRVRDEDAPRDRRTDLESALPPVRTDEEAIEEYELGKAADMAEEETAQDRMNNRKWVKGRSSIYVDAFNLALDTVLEEESHLFDEPEKAVFQYWKELDYERQYLYGTPSMLPIYPCPTKRP